MPLRPDDPKDFIAKLNDTERRLRAVERVLQIAQGSEAGSVLQTFEDGTPLGDTLGINFGAGISAVLVGDRLVEVTGAPAGSAVFDAIVDSTIGVSDPDQRLFLGIGEACSWLKDNLDLFHAIIAVRAYSSNNASDNRVTYTETADFTSPYEVHLIAFHGSQPHQYGSDPTLSGVIWGLAGFRPEGSGVSGEVRCNFTIENFAQVSLGNYLAQQPFEVLTLIRSRMTNGNVSSSAAICDEFLGIASTIEFSGGSTTADLSTGPATFYDCDFRIGGVSGTSITFTPATTFLKMVGCRYASRTTVANVLVLPTAFDIDVDFTSDGGLRMFNGDAVGLTITVPSGGRGRIRSQHTDALTGYPVISSPSTATLTLEGRFGDVTLAAPATGFTHFLHGHFEDLDIDGPFHLIGQVTGNIALVGPGIVNVRQRGSSTNTVTIDTNVDGLITVAPGGYTGTGNWLTITGGANNLQIRAGGGAAGVGARPFDLQSGSLDNFITWANLDSWVNPGIDAGTENRVEATKAVGKQIGYWYQDNVAASQTNVDLNLNGNTTRAKMPMVRAGSVTGIVVRSNEARTTGTLTVEVTVNGAGTGLTAVLDGTNTTVKSTRQTEITDQFAIGDEIGVRITTSAAWAPTTADITVMVEVGY